MAEAEQELEAEIAELTLEKCRDLRQDFADVYNAEIARLNAADLFPSYSLFSPSVVNELLGLIDNYNNLSCGSLLDKSIHDKAKDIKEYWG